MGALEEAKQNLIFAEQAPTAEMRTAYATMGILQLLILRAEQDAEYEAENEQAMREWTQPTVGPNACEAAVDGFRCMYEKGHLDKGLAHRAWGPEGEFTWPADVEVAK